jgi:hypothetical protein
MMAEWISVKDRLPEPGITVLGSDGTNIAIVYMHKDKSWEFVWMGPITHWMPLPEPPDEEGEG